MKSAVVLRKKGAEEESMSLRREIPSANCDQRDKEGTDGICVKESFVK